MAKILAISGSPRKDGNTGILLDWLLECAKSDSGNTVDKIVLNDLSIKPCQECGGCDKTGECVVDDDMVKVNKNIKEADIVVIGSPVYFGNVSAQTKIMIDRMQPAWAAKNLLNKPFPERGRKRGAFFLCSEKKNEKYMECASLVVDIFFRVNNIAFLEKLFISDVSAKGDILRKQSVFTEIKEIAERLLE